MLPRVTLVKLRSSRSRSVGARPFAMAAIASSTRHITRGNPATASVSSHRRRVTARGSTAWAALLSRSFVFLGAAAL